MEKSKEYTIEITEGTKAYIYLALAQGTVSTFVVKLLVLLKKFGMKYSAMTVDMTVRTRIYWIRKVR